MPKLPPYKIDALPYLDRKEQLAINLFDLDHVDGLVRQMLLSGKIDTANPIKVDPDRMDETAILLTCDLLTAASICDVLTSQARKNGSAPIRIYLKRVGTWQRVTYGTLLTIVEAGGTKSFLNPAVFDNAIEAAPIVPKKPKAV